MNVQKLSPKQILEKNRKRPVPTGMNHLKIILHNVRSMHNVGAAFRSADAFGVSEVLLTGFTPVPPQPEITKTAIGAEKYVDWTDAEALPGLLEELREDNYLTVGIEQTTESVSLPDFSPPDNKKICLLFGNEVTGLDNYLFPAVDRFVDIPQYGNKHSLNVSVTVGIALYGFLEKFWQ